MAESYISHPTQTGTGIIMPFQRWAKAALTTEELAEFDAACIRQNALNASQGVVQKSITVGVEGKPKVRTAITMEVPDSEPEFDPVWNGFWQRYLSDPSLTWTERP